MFIYFDVSSRIIDKMIFKRQNGNYINFFENEPKSNSYLLLMKWEK